MAMNKKEKEMLDEALLDAKINRALRWSDGEWLPDVHALLAGWDKFSQVGALGVVKRRSDG